MRKREPEHDAFDLQQILIYEDGKVWLKLFALALIDNEMPYHFPRWLYNDYDGDDNRTDDSWRWWQWKMVCMIIQLEVTRPMLPEWTAIPCFWGKLHTKGSHVGFYPFCKQWCVQHSQGTLLWKWYGPYSPTLILSRYLYFSYVKRDELGAQNE